MGAKKLSKDVNFPGLLRKTLLFSVFWGGLKDKRCVESFFTHSALFLSLGNRSIRFLGVAKLQ